MQELTSVFGIDIKLIVVQIVNFTLLLIVLWYFLYRPLLSMIEKRRTDIIKTVARNEKIENALKDAQAKRSEIIFEATKEADSILKEARAIGKKEADSVLKNAEDEYKKRMKEAEEKGEYLKRHIVLKSKEEIAEMIVLGISKTLR
jgi:F-type H+-transporting ATPase subunit b